MSSEEGSKVCPNCGRETTYIEQYESYYCYKCENYVGNLERAIAGGTEEGEPSPGEKREDTDLISELESISSLERQEAEDFPSEAGSIPSIEEQEVEETEKALKEPHKKRKKKFSKYRYRTRILKGSILPILFGVISIQMLSKTVYEFPIYYEYEPMIILIGFLLGLGTLTVIIMLNLVRAKKSGKEGCEIKTKIGVIALLPFLIILLTLLLFFGVATAWRFGTGFFLAAIFPPIIVIVYEANSKGKFFVKEYKDDPSKGRKLIFIK